LSLPLKTAALFDVTVSYWETPGLDPQIMKANIEAIETSGEDLLLSTNAFPSILDPVFNNLTKPIITLNSGLEVADQIKILYHVGQDESLVGGRAGQKFIDAGKKFVGCVNHEYGNDGTALRCSGLNQTMLANGDQYVQIVVEGGNDESFKADLSAQLKQNPDLDGLFTLGAHFATLTLQVLATNPAWQSIAVGTVDVNSEVLTDVYENKLLFAVDQQEYLQGFIPVVLGYLNIMNLTRFGTLKMNSGPLMLVNNVDLVKKLCLNQGRLNQDCNLACDGYKECPTGDSVNQLSDCKCYPYTNVDGLRAALIAILCAFAGLAFILSLVIWIYRTHPLIKSTTVFFSMLMVYSAIAGYLSTLLWVVEPDETVCTLRVWFTPIFFTLMLSSLLAKTWRVLKIFDNQNLSSVDIKIVDLLVIVACSVIVDVIILGAWQGTSTFSVEQKKTGSDVFDSCVFDNANIFGSIIIAEKGLLLLYGMYLAYSTRGVLAAFKDSTNISFSIFSFCLVLFVCIPLYVLTYSNIYSQLVIPTMGSILLFTGPLAAIFLPRVANIFHPPDTVLSQKTTTRTPTTS